MKTDHAWPRGIPAYFCQNDVFDGVRRLVVIILGFWLHRRHEVERVRSYLLRGWALGAGRWWHGWIQAQSSIWLLHTPLSQALPHVQLTYPWATIIPGEFHWNSQKSASCIAKQEPGSALLFTNSLGEKRVELTVQALCTRGLILNSLTAFSRRRPTLKSHVDFKKITFLVIKGCVGISMGKTLHLSLIAFARNVSLSR